MDIDRFAVDEDSIHVLSRALTKEFFDTHKNLTEEYCKQYTTRLIGVPVSSTPVQGGTSYTVSSDGEICKIVQFRDIRSPLDLDLWADIRQMYGRFKSF